MLRCPSSSASIRQCAHIQTWRLSQVSSSRLSIDATVPARPFCDDRMSERRWHSCWPAPRLSAKCPARGGPAIRLHKRQALPTPTAHPRWPRAEQRSAHQRPGAAQCEQSTASHALPRCSRRFPPPQIVLRAMPSPAPFAKASPLHSLRSARLPSAIAIEAQLPLPCQSDPKTRAIRSRCTVPPPIHLPSFQTGVGASGRG
eukprot:3939371-Prymnesium_polylepis.1